ncbi:MAG: tetratricopeptide repeat protein [Ferruginibacter sp.]
MNKAFKIAVLLVFIFAGKISFGQANIEEALFKAKAAVKLEDEQGKYDEAIKLFEEAQKLDPDNINYPYEIAYAYTSKKEPKKASDVLEKLLNHKDVSGRIYQALGNAYDEQGNPSKAIETYEAGLKKFPNSGELYLEMGNMKVAAKDYDKALGFFEKGIEMDPAFPSNYYWASKIFCSTDEELWGMIYGEIFLNLERNSKRTAEISKMLFNVYKSEIKFISDTSFSVSFSKEANINVNDLKDMKNAKLPYGMGVYEPNLMMAVLSEKSIDINSLDRIRTRFLESYFKGDNAKKYPNALFDYQQKVKEAGQLESYNHWILMKGDEDGFDKWKANNKIKWEDFLKWFGKNQMIVYKEHRFYRAQY